MARVQLNAITKNYGDFRAVDGVSLDIADGEFLVLLGPSGCGKTTTLRISRPKAMFSATLICGNSA